MKDNVVKFILIVSLLLNVSLLGTAAYTYYKQVGSPKAPFVGKGAPFGPPAAFMPTMLFEELSLTPEQVQMFRQKAASFHEQMNAKGQEVDRLRASLLVLMRAEQPDSNAIEASIARINSAQNEMQKTAVSHMLEFKSLLDKDQQKKFLDLMEGAMTRRGGTICPR